LSISILVDMLCLMKRQTDPDVLLLQAAADPTRLAILRQLSADGGVCACDFDACCDVGQPTVSHHLKVLRESGWVTSERHGTFLWYSLCPEAVARFRELAGEIRPSAARPAAMLGGAVGSAATAPSAGGPPPRVASSPQ
jgi:ArsR family transcriptional regulator